MCGASEGSEQAEVALSDGGGEATAPGTLGVTPKWDRKELGSSHGVMRAAHAGREQHVHGT